MLPVITDLEVIENPFLYHCYNCIQDFYGTLPTEYEEKIIRCPHCEYQQLIKRWGNCFQPIMPQCEYECQYVSGIGFVAEVGCPYHDH